MPIRTILKLNSLSKRREATTVPRTKAPTTMMIGSVSPKDPRLRKRRTPKSSGLALFRSRKLIVSTILMKINFTMKD